MKNTSDKDIADSRLWNIYQAINDWIKFADTKAGVALAVQVAFFAFAIPGVISNKVGFGEQPVLLIGLLIITALATATVFFGIRTIIPRLNVGEAKSLVFFAHIAKSYPSADSFRTHSKPHLSDDDGFHGQILDQIWANSRVAWRKHKDSAYCLRFFAAEMGVSIVLFLYLIFS